MTYNWVCKDHEEPHFQYSIQSMLTVIKIPSCDLCGAPMRRVYDVLGTHFHGSGFASKE